MLTEDYCENIICKFDHMCVWRVLMSEMEEKIAELENKIKAIMKNQELDRLLKEYKLAQENHHHYDRLLPGLNSFLVASTLAALWLSIQYDPIRTDLRFIILLCSFSILIAILWLFFTHRLGLFLKLHLKNVAPLNSNCFISVRARD